MRVQCSNCGAVYQIDDSKIPEKGIHATCKKCKTRFRIKKKGSTTQQEGTHEEIIPCPKCGHVNIASISSDVCVNCGFAFSDEDKKQLTITIDKEDWPRPTVTTSHPDFLPTSIWHSFSVSVRRFWVHSATKIGGQAFSLRRAQPSRVSFLLPNSRAIDWKPYLF